MALTWDEVAAWRVRRQHLDRRAPAAEMLDVASRLCGVHAQVMSSAEMTLWARVDGLARDDVQRALLEERTLVKTWAMRGTLHLLPTQEMPLWLAATATLRHFEKPSWSKAFGVTQDELRTIIASIGDALAGEPLTREQLADAVSEATTPELGDKLRESWGALLKPAAFRGQLCFGPADGQKVSFTRPDVWAGVDRDAGPDGGEALREAARRFLRAYAPATREDFGRWWAQLAPAPARRILASLGDEVETVDVEGEERLMLAGDAKEASGSRLERHVRLLPAFDQYVVAATKHATCLMPGDFSARVYRPQGWLSPVLLVDGRMRGVWRGERKGGRYVLRVEPFDALPRWVRGALEQEAEGLASFMGGTLDLELGAT